MLWPSVIEELVWEQTRNVLPNMILYENDALLSAKHFTIIFSLVTCNRIQIEVAPARPRYGGGEAVNCNTMTALSNLEPIEAGERLPEDSGLILFPPRLHLLPFYPFRHFPQTQPYTFLSSPNTNASTISPQLIHPSLHSFLCVCRVFSFFVHALRLSALILAFRP